MSNNNRRRRPRPAGAPEPRDHQAPKSPAQREAEGADTVNVHWRGFKFTVPSRPELWDYWAVSRPLSQNNYPETCLGLLGPRQASQIHAAYPQLTNKDAAEMFAELFNAIAEACGFGNSGN